MLVFDPHEIRVVASEGTCSAGFQAEKTLIKGADREQVGEWGSDHRVNGDPLRINKGGSHE